MNKIMYSLVLGVILSVIATVYSNSVIEDLSSNITRLHIIANSDTTIDQEVKLEVRDKIIEASHNHMENNSQYTLNDITNIANSVLLENGFEYSASTEYGNFEFPKKVYDGITLPEGDYNSVRVLLGDAVGQNWWCVMYPPLCFTEETTGSLSENGQLLLSENLHSESYDLITQDNNIKIELKFKIVEIVQELMHKSI